MAGHHHGSAVLIIYVISNAVIAIGYGVMPALVLPYLPLTRRVMVFGGAFFALCGLTHASMALGQHHVPVTWFWTVEHLLQALATWCFIVTFHLLLRQATIRRRRRREKIPTRLRPGARGPAEVQP